MKIANTNPNLRIIDLLKAIILPRKTAEKRILNYFNKITGKKYIILANSCRTALYIAYSSLAKKGEVITTPLTCKVAIEPIIESGNTAIFSDIKLDDLNIDTNQVERRITKNTIAIQVIHLGGNACDISRICSMANKHKLLVIEDCAQALEAKSNELYTGYFGDISCFSLIKNAYGIGGGILATNSEEIFLRCKDQIGSFENPSKYLLIYRIIRNLLDTKINILLFQWFAELLRNRKNKKVIEKSIHNQLHKISPIEIKIAAVQIFRFNRLHKIRKEVGMKYYELLQRDKLLINSNIDIFNSTFTKFYIYNSAIETRSCINYFEARNIEIMHLEQKWGSPYQEKLISETEDSKKEFPNYWNVHDHMVSLPIHECLTEKQIVYVVDTLRNYLKNE